MQHDNLNKTDAWQPDIRKMTFGLSEERPFSVIQHEISHKVPLQYDMHYGFEFGILTQGRMRRRYHNFNVELKEGQVWLCGIWEPHGWEVDKTPCKATVIIILPSILAHRDTHSFDSVDWLKPFTAPPDCRPQVLPQQITATLRIADDLHRFISGDGRLTNTGIYLKIKEILLMLFENWEYAPSHDSIVLPAAGEYSHINKAIQMVFENTHYISSQRAAQACRMNRNTFASSFMILMGISFAEFALRYRISSAAEQLKDSAIPIKRIAHRWGFIDSSHFNRSFTRYYNCSPSLYRKSSLLGKSI